MLSTQQKKLCVIIPALNETATISQVINGIPKAIAGFNEQEIIVIDDGSTDDTASKSRSLGATVVSHGQNRGVGAAFRTGIQEALRRQADIIVHIDSDGQFNPGDIPQLIAPILSGASDIVTCTRFSDPKRYPKMPMLKKIGNRIVRYIVNRAVDRNFTDVSCGYRSYSREAALRLTLFSSFTYTHEVILDAVLKGLRIQEIRLEVRGERAVGKSRVAKNIFIYGVRWLAIFFRTLRDSSPFQVFGVLATLTGGTGFLIGLFLLIHWLQTGQTFPYRSLVTVSAVFILLGTFLMTIALLADMLRRQRILIEELLYHARKETYKKNNEE
ncbi:MAG: glycosyltransferase family 2 protein [bacterium]|nr:glycosyltransferase family 2 protein [bacterium]